MSQPLAILVGASSGIGQCLAQQLARSGHQVAVLARRREALEGLAKAVNELAGAERARAYAHDVLDLDGIDPLWEQIEKDFGTPATALYFCAGILEPVDPDEFDTAKDKRHFDINTMGSVGWVNAAARRFGPAARGLICGISSVAQDRGRIGRPAYNASKAGMDTHLEAVRNRLWRKGVQVTTIRPGFVATPMTADVQMKGEISAERAAELILKAVRKKKAIAYVPFKWWLIMTVIKAIPSFLFRKLNL